MKKILLLVAVLSGVSFLGLASNTPHENGEAPFQTMAEKTNTNGSDKFKLYFDEPAGHWVYYVIDCGGDYDFMGSVYAYNDGDVIYAKMTSYDKFCG